MASEGDSKIRRIAIVLQSMDADTVRKLLSQFPEDVARSIRRAFSNLGTVTSSERAAAAQELHSLLGRSFKVAPNEGPAEQVLEQGRKIRDAIQLSPEARSMLPGQFGTPSMPPGTTSGGEGGPRIENRSWLDVSPETLARILQTERPTVVAAVLHELPVVTATSVLQLLPIPTASEAMAVMPHLHRNDPTVLNELLEQVSLKAEEAVREEKKVHLGLEKLKAILAEAPEDQKHLWTAALGNIDPQLPSALGWNRTAANAEPARIASLPGNPHLKLHQPPELVSPTEDTGSLSDEAMGQIASRNSSSTNPFQTFLDLMKIEDADFVLVLHSVEPETVLLALSGAEREMLKRVERLIPKKDIARFRQRVHRLNAVSLREIDDARAAILERANSLFGEGRYGNKTPPSLSAAA